MVGEKKVRGMNAFSQELADQRNRKQAVNVEESHQVVANDRNVHGYREIGAHVSDGLAVPFNVVIECCRSVCFERSWRRLEHYVVTVKLFFKGEIRAARIAHRVRWPDIQ